MKEDAFFKLQRSEQFLTLGKGNKLKHKFLNNMQMVGTVKIAVDLVRSQLYLCWKDGMPHVYRARNIILV